MENTKVHPPRVLELYDMSKTTNQKVSVLDIDHALFQPYPSELVFQNFTPGETYKLPLVLLNNDNVSRHVKLQLQESEYFHVIGPENAGNKVAPRLSATFTVFFSPQENKDYQHRLFFTTERERFEVPIRAIGPRAFLDFRSELHLPRCPVKASTQKTQLVRNIGNSQAKFKLQTHSPFSVTPSSGTLDIGESMQVTVNFSPMTLGDHRQDLLLHYHTGEDVYISLYGACEEVDVHLEPEIVMFRETYISLASVHKVSLINRSDIPLQYSWSEWPSKEEEDLCSLRENSVLQQEEEEREPNPTTVRQLPLLARTQQDIRSQNAKNQLQVLSHSCTTVEPMEGEVWPNITAQFTIVFKPEEAELYEGTIYCDVTGRESRLPLTIKGEGLGPKLQLSYHLMDMKNVFIGDKDYYEVLVSNKGLIDAPFKLMSPDTTFGHCFSFSPEEGVVPSGACQTVGITFQSRILGTFSEDLQLVVTGQLKPLILTFRGCVVGPTFHFSLSELSFGDVAFGFPSTLNCTLFNTSYVPMKFALRVLGDGLGSPSVTSAMQVSEVSRTNWKSSTTKDQCAQPKEFTINPAVGSVHAMSNVNIKMTLCSNTVKRYRLAMVVDVEDVGMEISSLPISARCVVPEIVVETSVLDFKECFLNHPYEQQVQLTNPSSLPVCYGMCDQEYKDSSPVLFSSSVPRGVIPPHSSESLPVFLMAKAKGVLQKSLHIAVFGSTKPPLEVALLCTGKGPVVYIPSSQLDFGRIPVLTDITKTLLMSNQSPIPANFTTRVGHRKSFWHVEPSEGEIPPESQLEFRVVANLKDTLSFQDTLEVIIEDRTYTVQLFATGTGTTIVSDRPFGPSIDLGTHFSHGLCHYHFKLTNLGQRMHRMHWGVDGFLPCTKTRKGDSLSGLPFLPPITTPKTKDVQTSGLFLTSSRQKPVFSISPSRIELFPGCSVDMELTGSSDSPKVVRERLVCRGIVGQQGYQEQILSVDITCRFVAPVLSFSSKQLNFFVKKVPGKSLKPIYEKLVLKNVSTLFLSMTLSLKEPFSLCEAPGTQSSTATKHMVLGEGNQAELWVCFDPDYCQDRVSLLLDEFLEVHYQEHPQEDMVALHAEVHFPNLHFSSTTVDFGYVLNFTEVQQGVMMTNCSQLPVTYCWGFLEDQKHSTIRETELHEKEGEKRPENETGDGRGSSRTQYPPSSDYLCLTLGVNERNQTHCTMGVEEVFDILPVYGHLQPGDQQLITFSFYGHKHISKEVVAQCHVEEGPTYEIRLRGEASVISYSLDSAHVDFGLQLFDQVGEAAITLRNTGKVGFKFRIINPETEDEEASEEVQEITHGEPMVIPSFGYMEGGAEHCLRVLLLPGSPEFFEKHLQLQVAFLPPEDIIVTGEGVFPRINLNLPRTLLEYHSDVVQQAKKAVEANGVREPVDGEGETTEASYTYEQLLHMEMERALVKESVLDVTGSSLELRGSVGSFKRWQRLYKFLVPEYILDFGYVIPGKVLSHTVNVTNSGSVPVSFHANCKPLAGTGFSAELKKVKNLPSGETQKFTVIFDPQGVKGQMGEIDVVMPIQVVGGLMVQVRLCAAVTLPAITVPVDTLQFDAVQCGMCQLKTIQLLNKESVPCHWSIAEDLKPFKKVDKFLPLHQRKKILAEQQPPPVVFEMTPTSGTLTPGERVNVQIKFSPAEEQAYNRQLVVHVADSRQQVFITAQGQGEEPQLEFCPPLLELGPCLPFSIEAEVDVTVKNPCSFPIEFYSLEFDTQYLEEEKILRLMQGYDETNNLLLPPRVPGEGFPKELLDYYKEYCSHLKNDVISETTREISSERLGGLEMTPVSRAIACHMGVDLSSEGLTARNLRGIAIIVYGAPLTDERATAAALAQHYGGVCLSIDAVVTDVLVHGTSAVCLEARQLFDCAAAKHAEKAGTTEIRPAAHNEALYPSSNSASLDAEIVPEVSEDHYSTSDDSHPQATEQIHIDLSLGGDVAALSRLLPDQLLVNILTERFQLRDCHHAIAIDSLKSVYTQSLAGTLQIVLKALKNRKHIYVVNLSDSYAAKKARESEQREAEEALQKERESREEQWLNEKMDEEWYDALPEEQKEYVNQQYRDKLQLQKLREIERLAKEEEEKRQQEVRRLGDEDLKKKSKKGGKKDAKEVYRSKSLLEGKQSTEALIRQRTPTSGNSKEFLGDTREQHYLNEGASKEHYSKECDESQKQTEETKTTNLLHPTDKLERQDAILAQNNHLTSFNSKESLVDAKEQHHLNEGVSRCKFRKGHTTSSCSNVELGPSLSRRYGTRPNLDVHQSKENTDEAMRLRPESSGAEDKLETNMSDESELQIQYSAYERSKVQVEHILQHWDQGQGLLLVPLPSEGPAVSEEAPAEKQNSFDRKSKKAASGKTVSPMPTPSQMAASADADKEGDKVSPRDLIPHIVLNVAETDCTSAKALLKGSALPPLDDVLDDLGLGPSGPPIPPATTLSVVPFPKDRQQSNSQLICDRFIFLVPSGSDIQGDGKKDSEEDTLPSVVKEEAVGTVPKSRSRGSIKEIPVTKDKKSRESHRHKSQTSAKIKAKASDSSPVTSECTELDQHPGNLEQKRNQGLTAFRWVVPANGEVVLKIWFYSESPGKFEQTFHFELLGTRRPYQLTCRGICTYPSISNDYMTLFAHSKKMLQMGESLKKAYLVKPGYFEFGPLLCSKSRDRYKESRYPENKERLVIHNNSDLDAEVQFHFQHDTQADTYLLHPPAMTLKPDEKKELTVWAYPTKAGQMKDSIVCCIKDNPELVIVNLSCWGFWPALELESKHLHFDRILLHRRESRSLILHNKTALPVSWRLQGVEELGDEFSVPQDQGIISPNTSWSLSLHFKAKRALHIKKILRLEVSDVEKIVGIVHTENIQVTAEAYDINLSISPDGFLDFGTIRVFEETKLSLRMKNQGKYEIAYKFTIEQTDPTQPNPASVFTVSPQRGTLMPQEKSTTVQIVCRPKTEVSFREQPILSCQVIEPNIGNGGETIAILAINVSVQSVFSRYKITPVCGVNFGPLVYGCKKSQSFTVENTGVFETHFSICRKITDSALIGSGPSKKILLQDKDSGSFTSARNKLRCESFQKDISTTPSRLILGIFSVSPCAGILQPGSLQVVTVDCTAEQLGNWNEGVVIDFHDRDPSDHPKGIPYRLLAEVCKSGIMLDMASIFEEHHLCHNSRQLSSEQFAGADGIYVLDDKKFIFNKVLVRESAQARFKLTNNSKVPCVLSLSIKHGGAKLSRNTEVFELSATTLNIPAQSHSFAVVTFTPQLMQQYSAVFEATMEGTSRMTPTFKTKVLEFDLFGEGNMPSVCVVRPTLRNSRGSPMLQFRRVIVGRRRILPLVLLNDGNVPAQVQIDMLDKNNVFTLKVASGSTCSSISTTQLEGSEYQAHRAILTLNIDEQVDLEVSFCSNKLLSVKTMMTLQVEKNEYSRTTIQVTGESYQAIISFDNISTSLQDVDQDDDESGNYEVLNLGDCHVDFPHQESFTMTNHSSSQVVRFEWPPPGLYIFFSPQVGHLHAGCSKEVTVTFRSSQPVTLNNEAMRCKFSQIEFQQPVDEVADWDDRQRTGQWLQSAPRQVLEAQQQQPEENKVTERDHEPCCSVVEGSQLELELRISAVCDYVKFSCNTDSIHFKNTMLYQTRREQLQMVNQGPVKLEFSWQVHLDPTSKTISNDQSGETSMSPPGSRSTEAVGGPKLPHFSIEPSVGAIEPGSIQIFSICFSPLEVGQFQGRLLCTIPNLQDRDQCPCISVCGRSLQPLCHFDLEDSDYISGNRRSPEFKDHLDPNIRVIQFNAVGLSVPSKRSFLVLNPTSKAYSYKWKCEDTGTSQFHCLTLCGTISPGEKVEMCFEYVAEQLDVVESFWSFAIETLSLSLPFLCVGNTREPLVYLSRPHLDFGELLVGHTVEQTVDLVNGEEVPFHFSVLWSSLLCEDQQSSLILHPMSGTVSPKDRLLLSVSFTPCREGYVSFRLVVKVKRRSESLILTVKADCFTTNALVQLETPDGGLREINSNHQDTVDFGKVGISEDSRFHFLVSNLARFSLEVSLDLTGPNELLEYLEVKPQNATVEVGRQLRASLLFCPRGNCTLHDVLLNIRVKHGPTFAFEIKGRAIFPSLEFSFTKFNFGKCFVSSSGMKKPPSQTLLITNKGELDISIQCQFRNTSYLEIHFQPDSLPPGTVMEVPVTFCPQEPCRYHEKLIFILNSSVTKQVDILGQGTEMKLEVEDPRQRKVKFGSLILGQKVKKQVVLVNRSSLDLCFTLLLNADTPLDLKDLVFSPVGELNLKSGGGSCKVEIQFSPHHYIKPFEAELQAEFPGLLHPLLTIQGCCQGVEVRLDQEHLAFGAVVQHCKTRKKIVMMNTGHIGARFHWKTKTLPPELSVSPARGYISPGMEVPFDVTFAPEELSNDKRYENLSCFVENAVSPLTLTVTGSCIVASTAKEVVNFVCPVRGSQTQTVTLFNPTNQSCSIRPVIKGEQWSAAPSVTLEALQNKTYEINYRPFTMTPDGKKHLGSVFFSFPDGSGILYSLRGTADPPKAEDTVMCELPAKTHHTELLPVHNWLTKQQRFCVQILLKPDKSDATVSLKGLEYVDVPALAKRDYKISFFAYKEGQYTAKVTFHNEVTGEYLFYLVTFKVTSPKVLSTIELVTTVRRTVSATVEVENPLTTAICLTTECKCTDISAPPQHTVPGQSKGSLSFQYQPLCAGESTVRLSLSSNDLGFFHYNLLLRALPPPQERTVHFSTFLGSSHSVPVKFTNFSRFKTEYLCKTDCPDFTVDKSVGALPGFPAGSETRVEVCFEPHQLGELRGQLNLSSAVGGEYIFPLQGNCLPPKAQGPFSIRTGRSITIPFKNVFLQTTTFSYQVDNPCFSVKAVDTILSKKTQNILISCETPAGESPGPWFGKLTISSQRAEGYCKPCSWVYYLKGYRPDSS